MILLLIRIVEKRLMEKQKLDFEIKAESKKQLNFFLLGREGKWFFAVPFLFYINIYDFVKVGRKLTHQSLFEILWTVIPAIILVILAVPSLQLLYSLDFIVVDYEPIITVKVLGHQWYWSYEYLIFSEKNPLEFELVTFDSYLVPDDELNLDGLRLLEVDNPLIIPGNNYIRFLVSSVDVLHSWAVPSLGIKVDAVPGRLNQTSMYIKREGHYYGQCSEICGVQHAFMPIHVHAVSQNQYNIELGLLAHDSNFILAETKTPLTETIETDKSSQIIKTYQTLLPETNKTTLTEKEQQEVDKVMEMVQERYVEGYAEWKKNNSSSSNKKVHYENSIEAVEKGEKHYTIQFIEEENLEFKNIYQFSAVFRDRFQREQRIWAEEAYHEIDILNKKYSKFINYEESGPGNRNKIWQACTWGNTKETPEQWQEILSGNDEGVRQRLFQKMFFESIDYNSIVALFDTDSIRTYLLELSKPLSRPHLEKRRKIWRYLFCGIREPIPELTWIKG